MKFRHIIFALFALAGICAVAQVENAGGVTRRTGKQRTRRGTENTAGPGVTERMQDLFTVKEPHDADLAYLRTIYRQIDLSKDANAPLYFPEDVLDGKQNLFRTLFSLVVDEKVPAYEYLDGREVFTDQYKIKVPEMLDRFGIYYTKDGSHIKIEEADVPTTQVMNYYVIEKWEFDKRSNQMKTRVVAICPVLNRYGDFGGENKYPMFWVEFDKLRPYLAQEYVFLTDDNNLPQYSLDDYFNLGLYDGDIIKTMNLRNLSMAQLHPDPDDLKHAQDSIENRLRHFADNLWLPTREEYLAQLEKEEALAEAAASGDSTIVEARPEQSKNSRTRRASTAKKKKSTAKPKIKHAASSNGDANPSATKSVRRRKK